MLREVTRPDKSCVSFQYDTFGRRIEKSVTSIHSKGASEGRQQKVIRFLWNGNNLFHEWEEKSTVGRRKTENKVDFKADYILKLEKREEEKAKKEASAYGWFNVFLLMLIFGGIILDKMGVRFTGMGACLLMVFGCGLKYYAITTTFPEGAMLFGFKMQVTLAALGYAIFGVGVEIAGITVSKIIVKWFKGKQDPAALLQRQQLPL